MATTQNGGIIAASQSETDSISAICSDLETARCKVNSMAGALGILAEGDDAPLFYTLLNAIEPADAELESIIRPARGVPQGNREGNRATARRPSPPTSSAAPMRNGRRRRSRQPKPATKRPTICTRKRTASRTCIVKNNATTAGDAALKLRVILHTLFVSDFASNFPHPNAALSSLLADLERIDAAASFAGKAVAVMKPVTHAEGAT